MAKYQMIIPDDMKEQFESLAKERGVTLKALMIDYLNLAWNLDRIVSSDSTILVTNPREEIEADTVAIPMPHSFVARKSRRKKSA